MKISIGADHRGFDVKQRIIEHFTDIDWLDVGTFDDQRTHYPLFAQRVCKHILQGDADVGILICGSGIGAAMAANRHKKIYAANCWNETVARVAKEHDGANVLVLPSDFISNGEAFAIIKAWLSVTFKGGVYAERLAMVDSCPFETPDSPGSSG